MGEDDQLWLVGSDAGYGFVCKGNDLVSKNRSGKALVNLPQGAEIMQPSQIADLDQDEILAITNQGRMLMFPIKDLHSLVKARVTRSLISHRLRLSLVKRYCLI